MVKIAWPPTIRKPAIGIFMADQPHPNDDRLALAVSECSWTGDEVAAGNFAGVTRREQQVFSALALTGPSDSERR
jgi:hypothetical protein